MFVLCLLFEMNSVNLSFKHELCHHVMGQNNLGYLEFLIRVWEGVEKLILNGRHFVNRTLQVQG